MWEAVARFVLKHKLVLLIALFLVTAFMGWHASKVQMSYEFSRAIPTDNAKYISYQQFRKQFGEDGNMMVIGFQSASLLSDSVFGDFMALNSQVKSIQGVENVLSISSAINLKKDAVTQKLKPENIFKENSIPEQSTLHIAIADSAKNTFFSLPFYKGVLYNAGTNAWLMAVRINKDVLNSKSRSAVVNLVVNAANGFGRTHDIVMHYSGLPLIRTQIADKIKKEMNWFLIGSVVLLSVILLVFFRSISIMILSVSVVLIGVIWSMGTLELMNYKITLLTVLIPTLIVIIGIPNCIYFLNKYHISFNETGNKEAALVSMISKMGVVTLFCNIAAAIGFAVFAFTKSDILKEFGAVAGINIIALFLISFILIPSVLSYLAPPHTRHTKYLDNKWLVAILDKLEIWALDHRKITYGTTLAILAFSIAGIFQLHSVGFIVDDLPKTDPIYRDLKFFEKNFKGVMPLEIIVDTRQKNGLRKNPLRLFAAIDSLSQYIAAQPEMGKPLSIVEGLKFAKQAYYDGDSNNYALPNDFELSFLAPYLNTKSDSASTSNNFTKLLASFMDSSKQKARISVNMADVGSKRLPELLQQIQVKTNQYFDSTKYHVELTGASVTFLEGSSFIIKGLKDSIIWAFALIALCMLYLFRSFRILLCSLIPNIIPLVITAGIMGWVGVPLKPSTVLVFSVALGIAIDITIRFLVNYKQEQKRNEQQQKQLIIETIHTTGISIIYTSMVLIAGFIIFCFSGFGGTQALGWLTSLTLIVATFTNLILLPALLISSLGKKN